MQKKIGLLITVCILIIAFCIPASAHSDGHDHSTEHDTTGNTGKMMNTLEEVIHATDKIHKESEYIADDTELDDGLRDNAEEVHQKSHDIEHKAEDLIKDIDDLEMDKTGDEISELKSDVADISSLVNDIEEETPESHIEHADAVDHEYRELKNLMDELDTTYDEFDVKDEMKAYLNNIIHLSDKIHTETEYIADDTELDDGLRDNAEEVHQKSHDIEHKSNELIENIENNEAGVESSEFDELKTTVINIGETIHHIDENTPESHLEHAEETHNNYHDLQKLAQKFEKLVIMSEEDKDTTNEDENTANEDENTANEDENTANEDENTANEDENTANEDEATQETENTETESPEGLPGFESLLAIIGLLAVAFIIKRR
ncbi:MAG: PGF-CTERM sorting domain-containing protein [Methanohalobium sp.]|uniref:PGF-CTERM sorting domain-containing protein n=1 Tax=Methanohalobium sp. TaxID=2837493 RepID=UPI0039782226